jgi:glucosamine--fructose-6-phosphate aminotransferase (isomerizing)
LRGRIDRRFATARLDGLELSARELARFRRIKILGCGSACISGLLGARLIERLSRMPCDAESAAEFRYRNPVIEADTLYVAVSQSGETFDTLAVVEEIKRKGGIVIGVVNVVGSTIARACGRGIYLHAGPEIAVVATKTFISTLVAFVLFALHLGRMKDVSVSQGKRLIDALDALPDQIEALVAQSGHYQTLATKYARFTNAYFVGRNEGYALAMEGALKLKEVSYLHAEAYPASELKHGPLALISPETLTVAIVPSDDLFEKNISTIEEIHARRGPVLALCHTATLPAPVDDVIVVPKTHELLDPLLMLIPLQLFAYHVAAARGCDIDQPRNLAKSVTVE